MNADDDLQQLGEALEEARELIDNEGKVPKHLRNAVEGQVHGGVAQESARRCARAVYDDEGGCFRR